MLLRTKKKIVEYWKSVNWSQLSFTRFFYWNFPMQINQIITIHHVNQKNENMDFAPCFHLKEQLHDCCLIFWARNQINVILYLLILWQHNGKVCANTSVSFIHKFGPRWMQHFVHSFSSLQKEAVHIKLICIRWRWVFFLSKMCEFEEINRCDGFGMKNWIQTKLQLFLSQASQCLLGWGGGGGGQSFDCRANHRITNGIFQNVIILDSHCKSSKRNIDRISNLLVVIICQRHWTVDRVLNAFTKMKKFSNADCSKYIWNIRTAYKVGIPKQTFTKTPVAKVNVAQLCVIHKCWLVFQDCTHCLYCACEIVDTYGDIYDRER